MKNRIHSFKAALNGVLVAYKSEWNLKFHFLAAVTSIALAFYVDLNCVEFSIILMCIALVISMELFNTGIEYLCDFIHPEKHESIKKIKDVSAAAVLFSSVISFVVGCILFLPKVAHKIHW